MANDPPLPDPAPEPPPPAPARRNERKRVVLGRACLALGGAGMALGVVWALRPYYGEADLFFWGGLGLSSIGLLVGFLFDYCPPAESRAGRRPRALGLWFSVFALLMSLTCVPYKTLLFGFARSHDGLNLGQLG